MSIKKTTIRPLIYAPVPPPYSGPEISTEMLLKLLSLENIELSHVKSNIRTSNVQRGKFDLAGILTFIKVYFKIISKLIIFRPSVFYMLITSNRVGFLRDTLIILLLKVFNIKIIVHYRGGFFDVFYKNQKKYFQLLIRIVLNSVDKIIVQADKLADMFKDIVKNKNICTLYNCIDFPESNFIEHQTSLRCNLLFIGHLSFAKGFYDLAKVYKEIDNDNIYLSYAGEKWYKGSNTKLIGNYLSGEHLNYYLRNQKQIADFLDSFVTSPCNCKMNYLGLISGNAKSTVFQNSDIFILPSYTEGFSMSVLEAMWYGLPVIATAVGALPEIIRNGVNGYLISPGDQDELKRRILQLASSPLERKQIGETNHKYVRETFSPQQIVNQFVSILHA
jgi:glycosyltransferase involved in cell wall biosynthesis